MKRKKLNRVPMLDGLDREELMAFWAKHQRGRGYRELFPEGGPGTKKATAGLANYAAAISTAMLVRGWGWIETANQHERIADIIYNDLPAFAKW